MKIRNYLFTIALVTIIAGNATAQDYKIPVQNTKEGKLTLENFPGNLPVEGYSGTEIIITSDADVKPPERAKGLKPIYAQGTDNTGLAIAMEKNGNQVTLKCLLPIYKRINYKIKVPDNFSVKVERECGNGGDLEVTGIKNEIEIKNCHNVKLKNISGPLVVSTISGDIDVSFSELSKDKPVSLAAISGEIDITIPSKSGVDLEMKTITGNLYSDFDFSAPDKGIKQVGGSKITSKLNGGGSSLKITNISGNIFLRKS
jgi:lia operon protein LiaG